MKPSDRQYIADLQRHAAETRTLLSNAQKPERERMVVRAFLRCVGVPFLDGDIQASKEEPIDVVFGQACFQVMTILGGRKPGQDWREREDRYQAVEDVSELLEPWTPASKDFAGGRYFSVSEPWPTTAVRGRARRRGR